MTNFVKSLLMIGLSGISLGASKPHVIGFGKPALARWFVGPDETQPLEIKVRPLYIDARLKEFTVGPPHDVTDRLFVVRRAFHLNDSLPEEGSAAPKWKWQRGGWLLVDRVTGHVSQLALPEFDTYYSASSWYRDYVAYCGLSDDGKKLFAVVAELGRKKPILKKSLGAARDADSDPPLSNLPDSECPAPAWQRQPARVTFKPNGKSLTFSVRGHDAEEFVLSDEEEGTQ
jgi:hypothetical protein